LEGYKFDSPKKNKSIFLDSYWSTSSTINIEEYSKKPITKICYLYTKDGKLIKEFPSHTECSEFIGGCSDITRAITEQSLIKNQYYVSNKMVDEFKPKPRKKYLKQTFYVYNVNNEFVGEYIGKEIMGIINLHSWDKINHIFREGANKGWYKNFYLSLEKIDNVPNKKYSNGMMVDIYDKFGNFIETLKTVKEVKEKYNVPTAKLKNI